MVERKVKIGSKDVTLGASAALPRLYRVKTGRDILEDVSSLTVSQDGTVNSDDYEIFENLAWVMAYHADKTVPENIEDWLEQLDDVLGIYHVMPQIMDLWNINTKTAVASKKNTGRQKEK